MNIVDRFLKYTSFDTQSSDEATGCPSTAKQMVFAQYLKEELSSLGLEDITLDEHGYLFATLPSNVEWDVPVIGFIAHMDTSPDYSGKDVKPRIIYAYDGTDIVLDEKEQIITTVSQFPELLEHVGEDLIVTDGHTLLGADDKAGIAEIVQAVVYLQEHPEIPHGKIRIGFNPDEEIGAGAHLFDVPAFGCEWAYTMDGSEIGELEFENFNAAAAKITIKGLNVHPGYAKGKMLNASLVAAELISAMPANETPETTEGYEGFYHLMSVKSTVEEATLSYIIRDHDRQKFEQRKQFITELVATLNHKYSALGGVTLELNDQYYNMRQQLEDKMHIIDLAVKGIESAGMPCKIKAIRGGTDGAQLSFKGLPCPNIFAGGLNFHGRHEFLPIQSMEKAMTTVVEIARLTALQYK